MSEKLKRCPFCGEACEIVKNKSFFQFQCTEGCMESATYDTPEDAADACNTRAEARKVEKQEGVVSVEAVKRILHGIDRDEIEDENGWWETSRGVEFGTSILKQIEEAAQGEG